MKWKIITLGEIAVQKGGSVDPKKHPEETFELYSIPAFDAGSPELLQGKKIGSSKKIVKPNDVMVSRIVPHIRRACVVGELNGHRQVASGEWIVFRSDKIFPQFLRWVLVGDAFHSKFMQTVSGVGGSLLRARPSEVAKIQIPLPPLAEQKRIAAILDVADELRAKRREAISQLDAFLQSTFIEMFGDPVSNPFGWDRLAFGEIIASGPQNGIYKPSKLYGSGTKILRIDSFYNGQEVVLDSLKRVEVSEQEISSYSLSESDIVINRVNSRSHLGKCALIPAMEEPILFESNMMRLHLDNKQVLPRFMVRFLQTQYVKNQILSACKDAVNQSSINQTDVKNFQVLVPPLELQDSFSTIVESVEQQKAKMRTHLAELDALFASLQHRAFNGEL